MTVETARRGSACPPFGPPHTVTVVICAYTERRWDSLAGAIKSMVDQRRRPDQLIVVIDHNEELLRRAQSTFPSDVEVLANEEVTGLSGARNTGVRVATSDVVAFLDDDAEADPGWLEELLAHYLPHVVGAGGAALPVWPGSGRPRWFPEEFDWVVGCSYRGLPQTVAPLRNLIGAAMSFRRSVFDEVGDFDTDMGRLGTIPLGCEETEFALRVRKTFIGTELVYVPLALVHHFVGAERTKVRYFLKRCYAEGVSKAAVARRAGSEQGLASERTYVRSTLPKGVVGGLRVGLRGDLGGFARAVMIVVGLLTTTAGYLSPKAPRSRRDSVGRTNEPTQARQLFATFKYLVSTQGACVVIPSTSARRPTACSEAQSNPIMAPLSLLDVPSLNGWSSQWDQLVDSSPLPSPFLRSWWLTATSGSRPHFLLVVDGARLVGGLALEERHLRSSIRMMGYGSCPDHLDLLAAPGYEAVVVSLLGDWLCRPGGRFLDLKGIRAGSRLIEALPGRVRREPIPVAPFTPLPDSAEAYRASLSPQFRRNLRRSANRFAGQGVTHRAIRGPAVVSHLDTLRELHQAQWGSRSRFLPAFDRFVAGCAGGSSADEVAVHELASDDLAIATVMAFEVAGSVSLYQSARLTDPRWRDATTVLLAAVIEDACARGFTEVDFLRGDEPIRAGLPQPS